MKKRKGPKASDIDVPFRIPTRPVKSARFFCRRCGRFVIEEVPILRRGMAREMKRRGIRFPEVKLKCPSCYAWSSVRDLKTDPKGCPIGDIIEVNSRKRST